MTSSLLGWIAGTTSPQATDAAAPITIEPLGWVFMLVSLTFVVGLTLFCYARLLTLPTDPAEELEDEE